MNILNPDNLLIIFMFFLPGFISLKIYDLFVPNEHRDFSKQFLDAIAYSIINFIVLFWLFYIFLNALQNNHLFLSWICAIGFGFIGPTCWPILYIQLTKCNPISKYIISPIKRPWDWFFAKREPLWAIVELSDGRKIGGVFGKNSYASSYPAEDQIYLEEVWKLDTEGKFPKNGQIKGSKGIIILGKDISSIEFLKNEEN